MTIRSSISEIRWKNSGSVASLFLVAVLLLADVSLFDTVKILIVCLIQIYAGAELLEKSANLLSQRVCKSLKILDTKSLKA
jgi:hypothetical protein